MVQAARISITGTQTMEDGGPQTLELVTDGSYCYEPGFALLSYVESEMTGLEGVVTEDMTVLLNEHGGVLDLDYRVEVEHTLCSRNRYHIEIQTI